MDLPISPPFKPMLAKRADKLPKGDNWLYEPKWDGFRALVFRDGDDLYLQSRDTKPLLRYFPELEAPLLAQLPMRCVVDGEVVIANNGALDFDALLQRIHPAESRVKMLSEKTPASLIVWDVLCLGDEDLTGLPFSSRRARLEQMLTGARPPLHITPLTRDRELAADWFARFEGAGLDGVMAKDAAGFYESNKRTMRKIKHKRTADCVIAGFRWHKKGPGTLLGSMLLGLYDDDGVLHHVGVAASFSMARREELIAELAPLRENAGDNHPWFEHADGQSNQRKPGASSRWTGKKDLSWQPLRIERTVEVSYDHMQGTRFRHTAHFQRWRPDKPTGDCTYAQLEVAPPVELTTIFAGTSSGGDG